MQISIKFIENLRLEASFENFTLISDQPIRYKGDGTAPSLMIISSRALLFVRVIL